MGQHAWDLGCMQGDQGCLGGESVVVEVIERKSELQKDKTVENLNESLTKLNISKIRG